MPNLLQGQNVDLASLTQIDEGISFGLRRTGALNETFNRRLAGGTITITTANAAYSAVYLTAGTVVANVSFVSSTTAAGTPTHWLFGLADSAYKLLATSADQLTAAWAASTEKTLAMTTAYTVPADGVFYLICAVVATTPPTLTGLAQATVALNALAPVVGFTDSAATISTALTATGTVSAGLGAIYGWVS